MGVCINGKSVIVTGDNGTVVVASNGSNVTISGRSSSEASSGFKGSAHTTALNSIGSGAPGALKELLEALASEGRANTNSATTVKVCGKGNVNVNACGSSVVIYSD